MSRSQQKFLNLPPVSFDRLSKRRLQFVPRTHDDIYPFNEVQARETFPFTLGEEMRLYMILYKKIEEKEMKQECITVVKDLINTVEQYEKDAAKLFPRAKEEHETVTPSTRASSSYSLLSKNNIHKKKWCEVRIEQERESKPNAQPHRK